MTAEVTTRSDQLRWSAILLAGTVLSSGVDFVAQILLVRHLAKPEFGAWSYGLATVILLATVAQLEMRQVVARFLPAHLAAGDRGRAVGAIGFAIGLVLVVGIVLAALAVVAIGWLGFRPTGDAESLRVVALLAAFVPIQAVDGVFVGVFAALGASRAIVLRQTLLGPALRLGLVVAVVLSGADLGTLAVGYVVVSGLGAAVFGVALWRLLVARGLVRGGTRDRGRRRSGWPSLPAAEMLRFAGPLLSSTLVWVVMESADAILIGYFRDPAAVATFRVVLPLARLNQLVSTTFSILYLPQAARAFADGDRAALDELYWKTTTWMTVLTFPVLLATTAFAAPLTTFLYGAGYAPSAPILALVSAGYAFQTLLGFNGLTVKVFGHLRYMVGVDVAVAALNVALDVVLIPTIGPLGAAIGTASSLVVHNVLKHVGLRRFTTIRAFPAELAGFYLALLVIGAAAVGLGLAVALPLPAGLAIAALGGVAAVVLARDRLDIGEQFPEIRRWPLPAWALAIVAPVPVTSAARRGPSS